MRTGENIRKRDDGRWEARCQVSGKKKPVSVYGRTYSEAKEKKKQLEGNHIAKKKKEAKENDITVKNALKTFLDHNITLKASSRSTYERNIENHIFNEPIAKKKIHELSQEDINEYITSKFKSSLSNKTISDILVPFQQCLHTYNIQIDTKIKTNKNEIKILSKEDYIKLIQYVTLAPYKDVIKLAILLSLFCGLRIGEICALQKKDIDLKNGIIHVRKTLQRINNPVKNVLPKTIVIIDTPKSQHSIRDIPIPNIILQILKNVLENKQDDDYVISNKKNKYIEPRTIQYRFKDVLKICNIENINFHSLRHTFATICILCGMDIKTLSLILGHSSVQFTMDRYVHSSLEHKREQLEKIVSNFIVVKKMVI